MENKQNNNNDSDINIVVENGNRQSSPFLNKLTWNLLDLERDNYFSCAVGKTRTKARYLLPTSDNVVSLLKGLAQASWTFMSLCNKKSFVYSSIIREILRQRMGLCNNLDFKFKFGGLSFHFSSYVYVCWLYSIAISIQLLIYYFMVSIIKFLMRFFYRSLLGWINIKKPRYNENRNPSKWLHES